MLRIDGLVIRQTAKNLHRIAQAGGKVISAQTSRNTHYEHIDINYIAENIISAH